MKRTIKAFIIDLDGVITDTAKYHYQAWRRLAQEEGIPFTQKENESLLGISRRESLLLILGQRKATEEEIQEMMERKNQYYISYIQKIGPEDFLPGAKQMLYTIKEEGFLLGLASASKNARTVLEKLSIQHLFHTISDGYSVKKGKPAPDLFLHTAQKLQVPPPCCAVIEDAASGVEGALSAGMLVIGIGPRERVGKAHHQYATVAQFNLQEILQGGFLCH